MLSFPAQIGPYRVLDVLGAGAMGSVFKVESPEGKLLALKMIGSLPDTRARFRPGTGLPGFHRARRMALIREAGIAMELTHPNIVRVFDYGQHCGLLYFVMEFLEGQTLGKALRSGEPTLPQRLLWLAQVCDALAFAHRRGVVHQDLHANNVFVLRDGSVKLLDFGLAGKMDETTVSEARGDVARALRAAGLGRRRRVSAAADVFRAGVLLRLALQDVPPFGIGLLPLLVPGAIRDSSKILPPDHPCAAALRELLRRAVEDRSEAVLLSAREFAAELRRLAVTAGHVATGTWVEEPTGFGAVGEQFLLTHALLPAQPASISIVRRRSRPRLLARRLARIDSAQYLNIVGSTLVFGLTARGYLEREASMPGYAVLGIAMLAVLPVLLLPPTIAFFCFAAAFSDVPRCRTCRGFMRRRHEVTQYAVNDTAISLGISDSLAALEAGLWEDAGRLLSLHGQDVPPMQPRTIAEAPLRLQLRFFRCADCPNESAMFHVQEHGEDRWNTRPGYVKAYRRVHGAGVEQKRQGVHPWRALTPVLEAIRTSRGLVRVSVVQVICAVGLLFMVWFTWASSHHGR